MKISKLNKTLDKLKKIVPFKNEETDITIPDTAITCSPESVLVSTKIDGFVIKALYREDYKEEDFNESTHFSR